MRERERELTEHVIFLDLRLLLYVLSFLTQCNITRMVVGGVASLRAVQRQRRPGYRHRGLSHRRYSGFVLVSMCIN